MSKCELDAIFRFLTLDTDSFQKKVTSYNKDLFEALFCAIDESNVDEVVTFIKEQVKENRDEVLNNLLLVEPLSLPIIEKFIASRFFDDEEFIRKIDIIRTITSTIVKNLQKRKLEIRKNNNDKKVSLKSVENELEAVLKEIDKHSEILEKKRELLSKTGELGKIKEEIKKIERELQVNNRQELERELDNYKKIKQEIDRIKEEIENSKIVFTTLPEDKA